MSELLAELFSSRVRAAVLAHLLPRPHLGFGLTDLSRLLGLPVSSLQHECYKLARIGLLSDQRDGAARRYRPNPGFPLLLPLTALVLRDLDWDGALRAAVEGEEGIEVAFVAGQPNPSTAATLVVVGRLDVESVDALAVRAAFVFAAYDAQLPELAFFPPAEWRVRLAADDPFVRSLLAAPRTELIEPVVGPVDATELPPVDDLV